MKVGLRKRIFLRVEEAPEVAVVTVVTKAAPRLVFFSFLFFLFLHVSVYQSVVRSTGISNLGRSVFPVYG